MDELSGAGRAPAVHRESNHEKSAGQPKRYGQNKRGGLRRRADSATVEATETLHLARCNARAPEVERIPAEHSYQPKAADQTTPGRSCGFCLDAASST